MKSEVVYNEAYNGLLSIAKELITDIFEKDKANGIIDKNAKIEDGFEIDGWESGVDIYNVIVWGNDYGYDGVVAKKMDVNVIRFDGKNIYLVDEWENVVSFADLPLNSMVFVNNCLEDILNTEIEKI
jgi:hypothetical protein